MPAFYEIKFLPGGPVYKYAASRGNYYEFEDGSHLDVVTTPAWCHQCGKITDGEKIEPIEDIDREIADRLDPNSELYRYTDVAFFAGIPELEKHFPREKIRLDLIEVAKKRREWRGRRRSVPKCIICGSTDIFIFPINEQIAHPAGKGTVEVRIAGMCSTSFNEWFFTPEGDRIARDTKSTYWHHPILDKEPRSFQRFLRRLRRKAGPTMGNKEKG